MMTSNNITEEQVLNPFWRSDNVSSMHEWHPCLVEKADKARGLVEFYRLFLGEYIPFVLLNGTESDDSLMRHTRDEMLDWLCCLFSEVHDEVWKNSLSKLDDGDSQRNDILRSWFSNGI